MRIGEFVRGWGLLFRSRRELVELGLGSVSRGLFPWKCKVGGCFRGDWRIIDLNLRWRTEQVLEFELWELG